LFWCSQELLNVMSVVDLFAIMDKEKRAAAEMGCSKYSGK
jgi:hypothetical protein